jgi:hypothetical protein
MELLISIWTGGGLMGLGIGVLCFYGILFGIERYRFFMLFLEKDALPETKEVVLGVKKGIFLDENSSKPRLLLEAYDFYQQMRIYEWEPRIFSQIWNEHLDRNHRHGMDAGTRRLRGLGSTCLALGMAGTCIGTMLALEGFSAGGGRSEAIASVMKAVSLAFATTLLGILSNAALGTMASRLDGLQRSVQQRLTRFEETFLALVAQNRDQIRERNALQSNSRDFAKAQKNVDPKRKKEPTQEENIWVH